MVPKYKHGSVDRNRLKRRLREIVRRRVLQPLGALAPADVVIRTLPAAYEASFEALERQLTQSALQAAKRVARAAPAVSVVIPPVAPPEAPHG